MNQPQQGDQDDVGGNSSPRSSSNRAAGSCEAVLWQDDRQIGPIRLPENRSADFIEHFNQTYEGLGLKLEPLPGHENKKIPGSENAAGDDVFS